ncbi:F0F1 ATP synthase subunit epsilon [Taylorella equigenitalis]|uniref:ATP synthase epsilon chain n=1 Tax=Taylorella equigenitalis ATCC 35865 TaxID=743973 RepID=A0ABM5N8J9_9BURK|nr:F0F1 ATP synthase subunit epsilon [Taylorella equigenitalis]AFN35264.1 ATP synthase epsilon chain [Taylorella equigenitalis ATCC 35865]ASY38700.1 F0F1 ATP synthase subunit epsilon [Taylorella equigenitalis]VEG30296.1 F-ATPase epsilon subunit [Taylorella equigenitalis ATCC 35865]
MSTKTLKVDVVSAEESMFSGTASMVVLPGVTGEIGVLPGHTPLISRIKPGRVKITREDGSEETLFVAGGLLEVQPFAVTVLADTVVRMEDLDEQKALEARKRAEESRKNATSREEIAVIEHELEMLSAQAHYARVYTEKVKK